jgi:hypothetical protein
MTNEIIFAALNQVLSKTSSTMVVTVETTNPTTSAMSPASSRWLMHYPSEGNLGRQEDAHRDGFSHVFVPGRMG